jgi:transposase InsO family protein
VRHLPPDLAQVVAALPGRGRGRPRGAQPPAAPLAGRKVFAEQEALILRLRRERKLGIKMLRNELARRHGLELALDTIHKVLVRHGENRLKRPRLKRKGTKRYSRPVPGDRVQMDTCKIRPGLYQYTAIDDCSRWQVWASTRAGRPPTPWPSSTGWPPEMPFPVQRVQTDRGQEFFAYEVQDDLRERHIKFRPNRPRAPHLNGKVERVQRTALEEFWSTVDPRTRTSPPARGVAILLQPRPPAQRPRRQHAGRAHRRAGAEDPHPEAVRAAYDPKQGVHPLPEHPLPLAPNRHACHLINTDPTHHTLWTTALPVTSAQPISGQSIRYCIGACPRRSSRARFSSSSANPQGGSQRLAITHKWRL